MISATLLLKGAPLHLRRCIEALEPLDEVLIYDNGASQEALKICRDFSNVRIVEGPFLGFGKTHNAASNLAKNDWILSIDSDEVVSKTLLSEIYATHLNSEMVYKIPRRNFYRGQWVRGCGWWPDLAYRLYNKTRTRFSDAAVHESILVKGMKVTSFKNYLEHYSYESVSDFLAKMQVYSDLFANENIHKKKSSPCKAVLHGAFAFFKSYILKKGILDGYAGFLISSYNGHTAFYKYLKLYELQNPKP